MSRTTESTGTIMTGGASDDEGPGDTEITDRVRNGDVRAYAVLYLRYRPWALRRALRESDLPSDAEDVVEDAFIAVLQSLCAGGGPITAFRPYLGTVITRGAHARNRIASRTMLTAENAILDGSLVIPDQAVVHFEIETVRKAYLSLSPRWQDVLLYRVIEDKPGSEAGALLGLSPNAVSSLTKRAIEGLTQAYLQNHIITGDHLACEECASHLGAYLRHGLGQDVRNKMTIHLTACSPCAGLLEDIRHWSPRGNPPGCGCLS